MNEKELEELYDQGLLEWEDVLALVTKARRLRAALVNQDVHWAMLQMHHPHLVGAQRDDIRVALNQQDEHNS